MFIRPTLVILLCFTPLAPFARAQQQTMTDADVIALANAGMSDDTILAKIQAAPTTNFETGIDGLKSLQKAHVSAAVIRMMINPHPAMAAGMTAPISTGANVTSPNDPDAAHSPGIYMYAVSSSGHVMTELERISPKQTKGSGAWVSGMTYGIKKFKVRGVFPGANAPVKSADANPSFYLYAPDMPGAFGGSYIKPNDFTLVKLTQKNDTREIVEGSGSIWGTTIGTDDKAKRGFSVDTIKPGVYKLTLAQPLPAGEYAFQQNAGMFYDFRILPPE
jgi:hypothetical protein